MLWRKIKEKRNNMAGEKGIQVLIGWAGSAH